jgi:small GTP-binding protein
VPGTTTDVLTERYGPFWLVDTPGFDEIAGSQHAEAASRALDQAAAAVLVLDASAGVRQSDANLYNELRALGVPTVVALNKIDLIKRDVATVVADAEAKMRVPVVPISAKEGTNVAEDLIPALIDAHPVMAVTIGHALPQYRSKAARKVIRQSSAMALLIGLEPIPLLSIPLLIGVQLRMTLRLAAIYGEEMSAARARELITSIAGGLLIRYVWIELAKLLPIAGWIVAAIVAVTGTVALGNVVTAFFEAKDKLSEGELRSLYKRIRWKRKKPEQLTEQTGDGPIQAS